MTQLLIIREHIKKLIGMYESYVRPASKFLLALITIIMINSKIGFATKLANPALTIVFSLICSFLPLNFILVVAMALILLHLYALSIECVIVVGVLLVIMFLLYFRFSPKDTILLLFTPLCFGLNIPYVIPLSAGLVSSAASLVSVGCGVVIYYVLSFISESAPMLAGLDNETMLIKLKYIIDGTLNNKDMLMVIIAFAITIVVVNVIRRLSVDHAWTIAIVTGALTDILVILIGDLKYATYVSIPGLIIGSILGFGVTAVIKFFLFNVDYTRTEKVQFEDDEYYYYVKAVPKNSLSVTDRKVRKIKGQPKSGEKIKDKRVGEQVDRTDAVEYHMRRSSSRQVGTSASSTGSDSGTKRIILPNDDSVFAKDGNITVRTRGRKSQGAGEGLTNIERAASAKARAARQESKRTDNRK